MKRVIKYTDGEEVDEDKAFIPEDIILRICKENGVNAVGNWKLTILLEKLKGGRHSSHN